MPKKIPQFLMGAALVFWGFQSGYLVPGIGMALCLEAARVSKSRWDLSDDDFARVWTFCTLLFLAALVYAFTLNEGPADFAGLLRHPGYAAQRNAGNASARTAAIMIRWMPMLFFPFIAAQVFSSRDGIPLETISLIMRRRWKRAQERGQPLPPSKVVQLSYPYFALCVFAAGIHKAEDTLYFWGTCVLVGWALWAHRSPRFRLAIWSCALALGIVLGHLGQNGIGRLQRYLETFNPQWLSSFMNPHFDTTHAKTGLGQIGRIKTSGRIVIRLAPKEGLSPPSLLQTTSYRTYKVETWYAGAARSEFETVSHETNETTWLLLPDKPRTAVVNIACYLDRWRTLLPLPPGVSKLENLPAYVLQKNNLGGVLAVGPSLVIFDAHYGPGATIDAEPDDREDLAVPAKEAPALDAVIDEINLRGLDRSQTLRVVNGFFQGKFGYSTWQGPAALATTNETALGRFLLRTRSGHCEYFASATTLLLRRLGIPARYAVGYAVHEPSGKKYVVRQRDAHAWCLVWNDAKQLWEDFDTTPASWVEAENKHASLFQFVSDAWSRFVFEFAKLRWGHTHLRKYILWALAPILTILLYQIIFRAPKRKKMKGAGAPARPAWPGLDSEFYVLERRISERGLERLPDEPLSRWLHRVAGHPGISDVSEPLRNALKLHYRYRFDPDGLNGTERAVLRSEVETCVVQLGK